MVKVADVDTASPSRREVLLHIGLPKTGSTAIQNWARANRVALAAEGIFVLPPVMEAHRLAVECITNERRLRAPDIANICSLAYEDALVALIQGASAPGVRLSFVSSEYFFPGDPQRAAAMFRNAGLTVTKVLCFVRRQDDLLASGYNQDVKGLGHAKPFVAPGYLRMYDWGALREDWQAAFPEARIVLRNFDHQRKRGTLIGALASDMGATSSHQQPATLTTNESLCAELLEIVRTANAAGVAGIFELAVEAQESGLTGIPFAFDPTVREALLAAYAASNALIAEGDPHGEFADFALGGGARRGADLTGNFPAEFAVRFMGWLAARGAKDARTN